MDEAYIQVLLNQHYQGFRVDGTFTITAYNNIINELKEKLSMDFTKDYLKNRMKTLKEYFNECYDFFRDRKLSGFAWSPLTKTWCAEPEVRKQLISEKPEAIKWKNKVINNYNTLEELFAKDKATEQGTETAKEKCKRWMNEQNGVHFESIMDIDKMLSQNEVILETFDGLTKEFDGQASKFYDKKSSQSTKNSEGKKKNVSTDEELEILKCALDNVVDIIREGNPVLQKSEARVYSEEEIYNELLAIGVEQDLIDDYYLFLIQNPDKLRGFFGCPAERRKNILSKMMKGFQSHS